MKVFECFGLVIKKYFVHLQSMANVLMLVLALRCMSDIFLCVVIQDLYISSDF